MNTLVLHRLLPSALIGSELGAWLRANAVESFEDEVKIYFSPEDIADFEHESSSKGREMNRLLGLLASATEAIKKGCEEDLLIEIPKNLGTKILEGQRRQNDDFIEKGYETEDIRIHGLVDDINETMEYFTEQGQHIAERSRGLTPKEKQRFLTVTLSRTLAVNE